MSALQPGANVLAVGNGPIFLLAAKTAAKAGYKTTIVSARPRCGKKSAIGRAETHRGTAADATRIGRRRTRFAKDRRSKL